jgi:hypothetical protein
MIGIEILINAKEMILECGLSFYLKILPLESFQLNTTQGISVVSQNLMVVEQIVFQHGLDTLYKICKPLYLSLFFGILLKNMNGKTRGLRLLLILRYMKLTLEWYLCHISYLYNI